MRVGAFGRVSSRADFSRRPAGNTNPGMGRKIKVRKESNGANSRSRHGANAPVPELRQHDYGARNAAPERSISILRLA
jgi:hypothetical protein